MADYLNPSADIIHSPDFEMAIVKIQNDLPLSSSEEDAVEDFVVEPNDLTPAPRARENFASTVLRQAKKQRCASRIATQYDELLYLVPPTSNACERLFSECKLVLTLLRSSTLPANFERMMFLRANSDMWTSATLLGCTDEEEE
ncbi:hypothetical protein JG688_00006014 [Phytophthora aleatoria]|uniref:HAT C-terminal dimerisation domain-containing protein n=1 Tax=Phytophthora aleatoria TaxID=2496075 RepID=A0A8J5M651_9STRA|nr:hypothetical protein JG688_00006014 [Phytophthora aleatoria]